MPSACVKYWWQIQMPWSPAHVCSSSNLHCSKRYTTSIFSICVVRCHDHDWLEWLKMPDLTDLTGLLSRGRTGRPRWQAFRLHIVLCSQRHTQDTPVAAERFPWPDQTGALPEGHGIVRPGMVTTSMHDTSQADIAAGQAYALVSQLLRWCPLTCSLHYFLMLTPS